MIARNIRFLASARTAVTLFTAEAYLLHLQQFTYFHSSQADRNLIRHPCLLSEYPKMSKGWGRAGPMLKDIGMYGLEALTAVVWRCTMLRDATPCSPFHPEATC